MFLTKTGNKEETVLDGASLMAQMVKNLPVMQETWVRFPGWEDRPPSNPRRRNWLPTPAFCLENPMDRGTWWATVHGVAESWTQLSVWEHTQGGGSKSILLWCMSNSVLPLFSSKSFIVSGLTFKSLIHFEFIFVYGVCYRLLKYVYISAWVMYCLINMRTELTLK